MKKARKKSAKSKKEKAPKKTAEEIKAEKEQKKKNEELTLKIKEIDRALMAVKLYPVATSEQAKGQAIEKVLHIYHSGNDTIRQLIIYMIHDQLAKSAEVKVMHTYDYFKLKNPALNPAQLRMKVYKAIFNYTTSLDGITEMIEILGRCKGNEAAKLLTYHFSQLANYENECSHILRSAIIDALGKSESVYALMTLLDYAHYSPNDRTLTRVSSALKEWDNKLDSLNLPEQEKERLREIMRGSGKIKGRGTQYG